MFECVVSLSQILYFECLCGLSRYPRCYMLNVCVCCLVIPDIMLNVCVCCLIISDVTCYMLNVCVVSLSQMLYVICLCVLSRYPRYYVKCLCVLSRYLRCYLLYVKCVFCLVISDVICYMVVCVVSLSIFWA